MRWTTSLSGPSIQGGRSTALWGWARRWLPRSSSRCSAGARTGRPACRGTRSRPSGRCCEHGASARCWTSTAATGCSRTRSPSRFYATPGTGSSGWRSARVDRANGTSTCGTSPGSRASSAVVAPTACCRSSSAGGRGYGRCSSGGCGGGSRRGSSASTAAWNLRGLRAAHRLLRAARHRAGRAGGRHQGAAGRVHRASRVAPAPADYHQPDGRSGAHVSG